MAVFQCAALQRPARAAMFMAAPFRLPAIHRQLRRGRVSHANAATWQAGVGLAGVSRGPVRATSALWRVGRRRRVSRRRPVSRRRRRVCRRRSAGARLSPGARGTRQPLPRRVRGVPPRAQPPARGGGRAAPGDRAGGRPAASAATRRGRARGLRLRAGRGRPGRGSLLGPVRPPKGHSGHLQLHVPAPRRGHPAGARGGQDRRACHSSRPRAPRAPRCSTHSTARPTISPAR